MAAAADSAIRNEVVSEDSTREVDILSEQHKTQFRRFLEIYLENIYKSFEPSKQDPTIVNVASNLTNKNSNRNSNKTKKNNNKNNNTDISKKVYDRFIELIFTIEGYLLSEITPDLISKDLPQLFANFYEGIKNYEITIKPKTNTIQNFHYLSCHGGMIPYGVAVVPSNIILIYLTPINRFGICKRTDRVVQFLQKLENRLMLQQNVACIDKIADEPEFNNRNNRQKYGLFKNSIVFLPGQKYYNIHLSYDKKDQDLYNFGFFESSENGLISKQDKGDSFSIDLSKYLREIANSQSDKLKYVIVDCCRNTDTRIETQNNDNQQLDLLRFFYHAYLYENFIQYYNIIMLNCVSSEQSLLYHSTSTLQNFGLKHKATFDKNITYLIKLFIKNFVENFTKLSSNEQNFLAVTSGKTIEEFITIFIEDKYINCFNYQDINKKYFNPMSYVKSDKQIKDFITEYFPLVNDSSSTRYYFYSYMNEIFIKTLEDFKGYSDEHLLTQKLKNFKNNKRSLRLGHVGRRFLEEKLKSIHDGSYTANPKLKSIVEKIIDQIGDFTLPTT